MEPSESKSAVGICPPFFFFFHVILIQSHLPACLITLINHHFGRGPVCFQLPSAPAEFQSSSWHQLFLRTGPGAPSSFGWALLQKPSSFGGSAEKPQMGSPQSWKRPTKAVPVQFYVNLDDLGFLLAFDFLT